MHHNYPLEPGRVQGEFVAHMSKWLAPTAFEFNHRKAVLACKWSQLGTILVETAQKYAEPMHYPGDLAACIFPMLVVLPIFGLN